MIVFPPESLHQLRRNLLEKARAGEIPAAEAFRQAVEADPNDGFSLTTLASDAELASHHTEAERYARAAVRNHPSGYQAYLVLMRALQHRGADEALVSGYSRLALEKLSYDEEGLEKLDFSRLYPNYRFGNERNWVMVQAILQAEEARNLEESPEVAAELEPHRLIHDLREAGEEALDGDFVKDILAHGADCAPLLAGILKEYGEDLIPEEDDPMVLRALALLGEIGDPAFFPAIAEFLELEDERFDAIAYWAARRMGFSKPAEILQVIRVLMPQVEAVTQSALAVLVAHLPHVPGRMEVVAGMLEGIETRPREDQEALAATAITAAILMQGGASPRAFEWSSRYQNFLSPDTQKEVKRLRATSISPLEATEDPITIYEICNDLAANQPVVKAYTPGRNDPCWCGSGKKYKKCHLEPDQGR